MKVAVFDVCGTIYNTNTTFLFLDNYFKNNKKYVYYRRFTKSFIAKLLNYPFYHFFNKDIIRMLALRFLKGESVEDVESYAIEFVNQVLPSYVKSNIIKYYNYYTEQDYTLVLMSGSLEVLIKPIASNLSADNYFSTTLESRDGIYTGKVSKEQLFDKKDVLQQAYPNIEHLVVVSDNITDESLFLFADKSYAVCNKVKQSRYWNSKKISNMELI